MKHLLAILALFAGMDAAAQFKPEINGTIRGKYEYQTEEGEGRFQVRNARFSLSGKVVDAVSYKAEIDLSDVPFTIDAHRSPHQQYFANRSFIAKQVGNVRDVGATLGYTFNVGFPIILEAGMFNGSGLTDQKDFWTNNINYSAKAQFFFPKGFNLTLSVQKIKPEAVNIMMYDAGAYYHGNGWHVEAEYLYKHYADNAYGAVHSFDGFVNYDIKVGGKKPLVKKVSPLARFDYMSDHSDGTADAETGLLNTTDYRRSRITGGVTLSLGTPFVSDIRLNYEKYFYREGAVAKPSERDKIVIEFMTRF